MRTIIASTAIMATTVCLAFETQSTKTTRAGAAVLLNGHSSVVNAGCLSKPGEVTITQAPAHGRISVSVGTNPVRGGPGIIDRCIGTAARAALVTYSPQPGFVGDDVVRYSVLFPKTSGAPSSRDFSVTFRVTSPAARRDLRQEGWVAPR